MFRLDPCRMAACARRPVITRLFTVGALLCALGGSRAAYAGNEVTDWNNEFLQITQASSGNQVAGPPEVAREISIIGNAMSDAVNAATGGTISYYAYAGGAVSGADANVAAAVAAYTALSNVFKDAAWQTPINAVTGTGTNATNVSLANNVILPQLQNFLSSELGSLGLADTSGCASSTSSLCAGYNLGIAAGNAVTSKQSGDGAVAAIQNGLLPNKPTTGPNLQPGTSGVTPGVYVPPTARPEMFPTWGSVTPTAITDSQLSQAKSSISGPPSIGSAAYATALLQTECQGGGGTLTAATQTACSAAGFSFSASQAAKQAQSALFWNDPGTTIQPPGHWLQIADNVIDSQGSNLLQSAQLTALLGDAVNDAGIAAWGEKYTYNLWRPITAIRSCDSSGTGSVSWNSDFTTCDSTWTSLIATPPHPDYVAGHPAFSGAAATVLANFFGTDNISFSSTSNYYCNGGTTNFNAANLVVSCTLNGQTYSICAAGTTPDFANGLPVDCTDGTTVSALNTADCNTVTTTGVNDGSPLICAITEDFSSFSAASSGEFGSEYSRVSGGIHTPFSVQDALTVGNLIGQAVSGNAGLPDVVPEPSTLSICVVSLVALTGLRRRRGRKVTNAVVG